MKKARFSVYEKRGGGEVSYTSKTCRFGDTLVSKTTVFLKTKHVEVFNTSLILETGVL
jgi:hypothetical protein